MTIVTCTLGFGGAQFWLDQQPALGSVANRTRLEQQWPTTAVGRPSQTASVELFVPHGAMASYALLGASWHPTSSKTLQCELDVGLSERRFSGSLAARVDDVRIGLAKEFASVVFAEVAQATKLLGAGVLLIDQAATGMVGSNHVIFEAATTTLMKLLTEGADAALDFLAERYLAGPLVWQAQ